MRTRTAALVFALLLGCDEEPSVPVDEALDVCVASCFYGEEACIDMGCSSSCEFELCGLRCQGARATCEAWCTENFGSAD